MNTDKNKNKYTEKGDSADKVHRGIGGRGDEFKENRVDLWFIWMAVPQA
jgi:hypothetical protein